jgi:hypothetical protein
VARDSEVAEKGEMKGTDRSVHVCPSRRISELQAGTEKSVPFISPFSATSSSCRDEIHLGLAAKFKDASLKAVAAL